MKALRYLGPEKLEVQEVPMPEPGKGEVLIKVKGCGICGRLPDLGRAWKNIRWEIG